MSDHTREDARIAALYRTAAEETPPQRVDAAIVERARQPQDSREAPKQPSWLSTWRVPFVAAGVAVVAASVVSLVIERGDSPLMPQSELRPSAQSPSVGASSSSSETDKAPADEPSRALPHDADAVAGKRSEQTMLPHASRDAPPRRGAEAARAAQGGLREGEPKASTADRPSAELASPAHVPLAADAAGAPRSGAANDSATALPGADVDTLREPSPSSEPRLYRGERAVTSQAARAPPQPPAPLSQSPAREPKATPSAKPLSAEPFDSRAAGSEPRLLSKLISELDHEPPVRWRERISALRREGRREDADALLAEFKRRYPTETVPAEPRQPDE